MPYNCAAESFHAKKLCSRLFSSEVRFFYGNRPSCVFETPFGGLRGNVQRSYYHRLIGKRVVDFPLVFIELFFARCYGWGATGEYRLKIGDFAPTGAGWPKISGTRGRPTNHSFSRKTRLNVLLYNIKILTDLSTVLSQFTRVTDGRTEFASLDRVCISSSAVKTVRW